MKYDTILTLAGVLSGKLTEEQIIEIRSLSESGILGKHLAKLFNISQGAISGIINNKTYRFIKGISNE